MMKRLARERLFYLLLALAITAYVYWGFFYTYLGDRLAGAPMSDLPISVHVHGISFLAWYALLGVQALLVLAGPMKLHRWLGYLSIPLALLMVLTGLLVIAVRMEGGLFADDQFWAAFSLMILSNLILFAAYYVLALLKRNRADQHRWLMIVAAASGSGAAVFRILVVMVGPGFFAVPAGILLTNLVLVIAAIGDRLITGKVHRVYVIAIPLCIAFEVAMLALAFTDIGLSLQNGLVVTLRPFFALS